MGHSDLQLTGDIERLDYNTQQLKTRHEVDVQSLLAIKTLLERLELFGIWVGPNEKVRRDDNKEKLNLAIDFPGLTGHLFHTNHPFWAGVYALSEIEWHRRVWTYQEVVLARNAKVFAEGLSVDWHHVVAPTTGLLRAMEEDSLFERINSDATIVGLPVRFDRVMWELKWQMIEGRGHDMETTPLLTALIVTRNRKSTLMKDKVYGLLAVVQSSVRARVPIDYTTTDGKVFASAVKAELRYAPATMISTLWEFFGEKPDTMEDLPSWCPSFASKSGPSPPTWHHRVSDTVRQQTSAFAHYEHFPGFQTISVKVLKLDTTAGCVDIACPLDDTGSQFPSRAHEAALKYWLVQLLATFSDHDGAPSLSREVTCFLHDTTKHKPLLPFETFWETLNLMLLSADSDLQPLRVYDCLQTSKKHREVLAMLSSQGGRYLFKTTSGEIGFSTRQPTPGNNVVLLPGSALMHMLTKDCTQYCGCVSLPGMSEDALLDLVNARENMWEMVQLR
jgi:hypothetical protein